MQHDMQSGYESSLRLEARGGKQLRGNPTKGRKELVMGRSPEIVPWPFGLGSGNATETLGNERQRRGSGRGNGRGNAKG